jgi:predicted dehydrogenase
MRKLIGVLIGCGQIAREHLAAVSELEHIEIVGICDLSPARAEAMAERFAIAKWFTDHRQMLAQIRPDLVHITTSPAAHFPIARECLTAGLNVLCEKPVTLEYHQFKELRLLAAANGCMLMENQNLRFHSSIRRIIGLLDSGALGDLLEVQVCISLNIVGSGSPYVDRNSPHFGLNLRGGVIGDFLPHIAYLAHMFTGSISDVRTIWRKRVAGSPLPADEFRALLKGERANAYVSFDGNAAPNGFWIRATGTRMHVEANLFEPPRIIARRSRNGEPALMSLADGLSESRDVLRGSVGGFWRKLAGVSSYDGLPEFIADVYRSLEAKEPQPIPLDEIDEIAGLVDRFTRPELQL